MISYDVIVAGAGPAGVAAALKCTQQGYNTLLLEKGQPGRHKPCGGLVPTVCADILDEEFGLKLPSDISCLPESVGVFFVPPSGRVNSRERRDYKLLNLDRDKFDQWLCQTADDSGVKVLYGAKFLEFHKSSETITVLVEEKERVTELKCRYLIGADGASSKIRRQIYPSFSTKIMPILQEYWQAKGDLYDYFYVFFKEDITPSYAYVIPKNGLFIIGTGAPANYHTPVYRCLDKFKEWLEQEFAFEPLSLERKDGGAIPYCLPCSGEENVILVGDAAGFCNPFTGEGIRLAIESGISAGDAIMEADQGDGHLSSLYAQQVKGLSGFIDAVYKFSTALTDIEREKFVATQPR